MNAEHDLDLLLIRHLDGSLSEAEARSLSERLGRDPEAARRLALFAADQAALRTALKVEAISSKALPAERNRPAQTRPAAQSTWRWPAAAAAAALLLVGAGFWLHSGSGGPALESGALRVEGAAVARPKMNETLEAHGGPAVLRLTDGSKMELSEASLARVLEPADGLRQVIALEEGEGTFKVTKGGGRFLVETPHGRITVLGTEFTVKVPRKSGQDGGVFQVIVHSGRVEVEHNGHTVAVAGGETFTGQMPALVAQAEASAAPEEPAPDQEPAVLPPRGRGLAEPEDDYVTVTGMLQAVFAEGATQPESISITTADATRYNIAIDKTSASLAKNAQGQEVTVSGMRYAKAGTEWLRLGPKPPKAVEKPNTGVENPAKPRHKPGEPRSKERDRELIKPELKDRPEPKGSDTEKQRDREIKVRKSGREEPGESEKSGNKF